MLKAQLHSHTNSDKKDRWVSYSDKEFIDHAAKKNFDVLAITCHETLVFSKEIAEYAKEKGILLMSGIEIKIEGKDVLIINADKKAEKLKTFKDLKKYKYKHPDILIIAPHPYFHLHSLGKHLKKNIRLFDAVEYSFFYCNEINLNKHATKLGLPLVGTADMHFLDTIESTYTLINAEKDTKSVIKALKRGNIKIETKPLTLIRMAKIFCKMGILDMASRLVKKSKL